MKIFRVFFSLRLSTFKDCVCVKKMMMVLVVGSLFASSCGLRAAGAAAPFFLGDCNIVYLQSETS